MKFLSIRSHERESLDDLDLKGPELDTTLHQLGIINKYLGNTGAIVRGVMKELKARKLENIHVVDLACGGGDILRILEKRFQRMGIDYKLTGIDGNAHSLE